MLEKLLEIARQAGEAILPLYKGDVDVTTKADASPLTLADRVAHRTILQGLKEAFPEIPVLSEESAPETYEDRARWSRFFLVDPLDGTKEFIKKTGEFTVNIALVEEGAPVAGVVHVPVKGWSYMAARGQGAFKQMGGRAFPIRVAPEVPRTVRVVASRDHAGPGVRRLVEALGEAELVSMGSSLKFCLVAEGKADIYFRDVPTMEWDTGAAQCIVEEAGGCVLTLEGVPLGYNKPSLRNPALLTVGAPQVVDELLALVAVEG